MDDRNPAIFKPMKPVLLLAAWVALTFSARAQTADDPAALVNPLIGTDSRPELSNGNTYPAITLPWGMNMWTPQTGRMGDGWQYQYAAEKIRGFKQTHQPSPWMNDYGVFSVMPATGHAVFDQEARASWFSHKSETANPYYYSVYLADADVTTEITPTERAARFRLTYPQSDSSFLIIDAFDRGSYIKILPAEQKIIGYSTRHSHGKMPGFKNYFVIYVDKPFSYVQAYRDGKRAGSTRELSAGHAGAVVGFQTAKGEKVQLKVASSFIGFEQAELNLRRELGNDDFETTMQNARAAWNKALGRIRIEGGSYSRQRTFYSALYRSMCFPNKLYEQDAGNNMVHYSPYTGKVLPGYLYGGTGFWDTFRALYPLLNLLCPSVCKEMQEGLINCYREGGWLPEWSSPGYANVMIGNNSASVVSEAWIKGLRGYDIGKLYEALQHGAAKEGPLSAVGRKGVAYYNSLGYVPYDAGINENAARTLEYAYDDFAIWQLGKALGRPRAETDVYARRCLNYRRVFDSSTRLMRGRNRNGSFQSPFNPFKWGDAFTEGNSWHYSWSVFHDVQGLIDLMGGKESFIAMLDSVFRMPPVFNADYYGGVIHEIREMQIANMGQYAHGNQPIQHMPYLYGYAGAPWKTQYWVREIMNRMYHDGPDGYCGDEDNGQTSAWYVFSALGFYPVCPATGQYVLGAPLFPKAILHLENGATFEISAPGNSDTRRYISRAQLNGQEHRLNWIGHEAILKGGSLYLDMSALPEKGRGHDEAAAPYSFSRDPENPLLQQ